MSREIDAALGKTYPPGSGGSRSLGCTCPVVDNCYGRGSGRVGDDGKPLYWVHDGCPLHGDSAKGTTGGAKG